MVIVAVTSIKAVDLEMLFEWGAADCLHQDSARQC